MLQQFTPTADSWNVRDPEGFVYPVVGWVSVVVSDSEHRVDPVLLTENGFETLTNVRKRWNGRDFAMERV